MDMSEPDEVANGTLLVPTAHAKQCNVSVQADGVSSGAECWACPQSEGRGSSCVAAGKMIRWIFFKAPSYANRGLKNRTIPLHCTGQSCAGCEMPCRQWGHGQRLMIVSAFINHP